MQHASSVVRVLGSSVHRVSKKAKLFLI